MTIRLAIAAVSLFAMIVVAHSSANAECALAANTKKKVTKQHGCAVVRHSGTVEDPATKTTVSISGDELKCGRKIKLGDWKAIVERALEICSYEQNTQFELGVQMRVLGKHRRWVSIERVEREDLGTGPTDTLSRRTYDWKTGQEVDLAAIFGANNAKKILEDAKKGFDAHKNSVEYRFDELAFALVKKKGKLTISFGFPHDVSTAEGTVLDVDVAAP